MGSNRPDGFFQDKSPGTNLDFFDRRPEDAAIDTVMEAFHAETITMSEESSTDFTDGDSTGESMTMTESYTVTFTYPTFEESQTFTESYVMTAGIGEGAIGQLSIGGIQSATV